ncbi:MAG: hypothetical protein ACLR7U_04590 [Ruthenibacterium lactatiformans]
MIDVLKQLRDNGNTVLVIEHDPDVMRAADHIIDIGWVRAGMADRLSAAARWKSWQRSLILSRAPGWRGIGHKSGRLGRGTAEG